MSVAIAEQWDLSAIGLRLSDPDLPYERYAELCWMLGKMHEAVRFAIGDAILYGEELYGEESYQAIEEMGLSEEARREYVRVAIRVPRSRRRKALSWSHHRAVAALEPAQQKEWLRRAEDESLSHHALREELRDSGTSGPSPRPAICRCCGQNLS